MTDLATTEAVIRSASAAVADGDWDSLNRQCDLSCGSAVGRVSVHRGDKVSLELDGLTVQQAVRLLHALDMPPRRERVTYDIPAEEVDRAK